ncbi:hypothetical protein TruAng_012315 [Truncatella angustata]|nr:hypothetical protein TruAng_012315 [Truncatella angustata]
MSGKFEPKVPVQLNPPKDDAISLDDLAKADGSEGQKCFVAIKVRGPRLVRETVQHIAFTVFHAKSQVTSRSSIVQWLSAGSRAKFTMSLATKRTNREVHTTVSTLVSRLSSDLLIEETRVQGSRSRSERPQ